MENKRIFVTGGGGLIGRHLVRKLLDRGYHVVTFDLGEQVARNRAWFQSLKDSGRATVTVGTILDRTGLATAMQGCDAVFHLAAMLGVRRTEDNRLRCLEINTQGTDNVLDMCVRNRIERVVVASSSEVYGEPARNPIAETDDTQGKTVYAVSKIAAEELTKGYAQLYPWLKYTIVRFFNTYGEGQVGQFVISRFISRVLAGQNPVVYGDGLQTRSYGHVDDVTDGLLLILESEKAHNQVFNLGNSSQLFTLRELAQKVIDVLAPNGGLAVEVVGDFAGTDRTRQREIFSRYCDTTKAERELGFKARVTIDEGIRRMASAGEIHMDWPFDP